MEVSIDIVDLSLSELKCIKQMLIKQMKYYDAMIVREYERTLIELTQIAKISNEAP